jgi:protein-export membrane protein SecD
LKPSLFILITGLFFSCSSTVPKISADSVHSVLLRENSKKFECRISDNNIIENLISLRNRFSSGWKSTWHTLPAAEKEFLFYDRENKGKQLAIFLDGQLISSPVIREEIAGGQATISGGNMTADEARDLAKNLNFGALPVPIDLVSTQTIGATLGNESLQKGLHSGIVGMLAVVLFMILWYRLPGIMATVALSIYVAIMLSIFKMLPVTLTAAGIAGFILSIGMAVDANIIIFERLKEELRHGKDLPDAINDGFARAWLAIRDGHVTSIISAIILFWFGTSLIQGFALTFGIGVIVSLFSAITLMCVFLRGLGNIHNHNVARILFGSGIKLK